MDGARPRVLLSYWYARKLDAGAIRAATAGWDVIVDSGAFSAYTSGQTIDVDTYAAWLAGWKDVATAAFSLDVIGDPVASLRNYRRLAAAGTGVPIVPVFHAGSAARHLDALLDEGARYIGFGGLVEHYQKKAAVMRWAAWNLKRCADAGAAVHGLGFTASATRDLPFYSVDSSTWVMAGRRGFLCCFNPARGIVQQTQFRNPVSIRSRAVSLRAMGVDIRRISQAGFMRGEQAAADRDWADAVSVRAFYRLDDFLRDRHQVPAPPVLGDADKGTKVYLAATSLTDLRTMTAGWEQHREAPA